MEARLSAALASGIIKEVTVIERSADEAAAAADAVSLQDDMAPLWPDENAEAAYLSEAKGRGETPAPTATAEAIEETTDASAALPSLEALKQRLPAKVLEAVDDLFRAKFTKVTRVPKKALKTSG